MDTCQGCREQLPGLALEALEEPEAERLRAHLEGCAGCQESLASLREALGAAGAWRVPEPAPDLGRRIQGALASEPQRLGLWQAFMLGLDRLARFSPTPRASLAGLVIGLCLFGIVLYPNVQRYQSAGPVAGCRNNQEILREALAEYARAHQGAYPASLAELGPDSVRAMPSCPEAGADTYSGAYQVSSDRRRFTLSCSAGHR